MSEKHYLRLAVFFARKASYFGNKYKGCAKLNPQQLAELNTELDTLDQHIVAASARVSAIPSAVDLSPIADTPGNLTWCHSQALRCIRYIGGPFVV